MTNREPVLKRAVWRMAIVVSAALQATCCHSVTTAGEPHYYEPAQSEQPKLIECDVAVYGGTPAGVTAAMETGETVRAAIFVDSTYEGDLLAVANVSYHVGREPAATYDESLGGQWQTVSWKNVYQFCRLPLSPYVAADDPTSGLLAEIAAETPGRQGDSNNAGSFSSDYVGGNYRWPDGTYKPGSISELPPPRRGLPVPLSDLYKLRERIF